MLRFAVFIIAVTVLIGLVLSGGYLPKEMADTGWAHTAGTDRASFSEVKQQLKADQELAQIDAKAQGQTQSLTQGQAQKLPGQVAPVVVPLNQWLAIKPVLTKQDPEAAAKRTGDYAEQAALAVGQDPQQAKAARVNAENSVRQRLGGVMSQKRD